MKIGFHTDANAPSAFDVVKRRRNILGGNAQRLFGLEPVLSDWKLQKRASQ